MDHGRSGGNGEVRMAVSLQTGAKVAIKHLKNAFADSYSARLALREIKVLRKLSADRDNTFTPKLYDVILANSYPSLSPRILHEGSATSHSHRSMPLIKKKSTPDPSNCSLPLEETHLFIVTEWVETDLKKLLSSKSTVTLSEQQMLVIMYNCLCALNFIHSANILHRDIKPANILIDRNASVMICDFGLARAVPAKPESV